MAFENRHDAMLLEILREKNSIPGFFESVFGFLARNTDFYYEMKNANDNMGFPPGEKEKIVFNALRGFDPKYLQRKLEVERRSEPEPINEVVIDDTDMSDDKTEKEQNIKKHKPQSDDYFQPNEYYNGAKYDSYSWSQTINDLEIYVRLPEHIKSSKNLGVKISSDFLKIQDKESNVILEGKLHSKCRNDVVWSITSGKLQITLEKIKDNWWRRLFENEPELDLNKIDKSRNIEDFPEETQAAVEKFQWDIKQKMLGKPTSDEIKNTELLRKAWDAEGSPFKGQPFDPSVVKFN